MKRILQILLIVFIIMFGTYTTYASMEDEKKYFYKFDSFNRYIKLPSGKEVFYYAQNTDEWKNLFYVPLGDSYIYFGEGGCVATTLANAVINTVSKSSLLNLKSLAKTDFIIDSKSLILNLGKKKELKFKIEDEDDFFKFLPLVFGQYSRGNNKTAGDNYRSTAYYKDVLSVLGLKSKESKNLYDIIDVLSKGGCIITSSGGYTSPIANGGHYFLIVDSDEEYIYCLDSFVRNIYKKDRKKLIEIIEPGLVRIKKENIKQMVFNNFMAVYKE